MTQQVNVHRGLFVIFFVGAVRAWSWRQAQLCTSGRVGVLQQTSMSSLCTCHPSISEISQRLGNPNKAYFIRPLLVGTTVDNDAAWQKQITIPVARLLLKHAANRINGMNLCCPAKPEIVGISVETTTVMSTVQQH